VVAADGSTVVGIGEVLWDMLPGGRRLGGAPCNVLIHLKRLGHRAVYVTAVGADDPGIDARRSLEALGIDTSCVATAASPTARAEVELGEDGTPYFTIEPGGAYESVDLSRADVARVARADPVALVYGTLAQRSAGVRRSTAELAGALPDAVRLYDVNLRAGLWDPGLVVGLAGMPSFIKMSREEAAVIAPLFDVPWPGTERFCRALRARLELRGVAVTAGAGAAALLIEDVYIERRPPPVVVVVDTVGSGDAFAAALVDGLVTGASADAILRRSVSLGALVASKAGATPDWSRAELAQVEASADASEV
jgi:fructokinase